MSSQGISGRGGGVVVGMLLGEGVGDGDPLEVELATREENRATVLESGIVDCATVEFGILEYAVLLVEFGILEYAVLLVEFGILEYEENVITDVLLATVDVL